MHARDTSEAAHQAQLAIYRAMSPSQRGEVALRMSDDIRAVAKEGIRRRHPEYDEAAVHRALVALLYGREVVAKIWPAEFVPDP